MPRRYASVCAGILLALAALAALLWPAAAVPHRPSLEDLLAPLAVGQPVAQGFHLAPPRRGEEHDVVLLARRSATPGAPAAHVEIHLLDRGRWQGIRETASFGVGYEIPRSSAGSADCDAVTEAVAAAIRANDPGGLGPVDTLPLRAEPAPPAPARAIERLHGARGIAAGLCLAAITGLLATLRRGPLWASLWLFLLGLALRLPQLGLPFVRDQDVQRLFTGHLPLGEVLLGQGLRDRHPPLYFVVLHAAQWFGQDEAAARAPAALAGALIGPAVVWGAWTARGRAGAPAALVGLACTLSIPFIARSREVSEIPLFALMVVALCACAARAAEQPGPRRRNAVVATHALALWTYYLAPLVIGGVHLGLWLGGRARGQVFRWAGSGILLGSPAIALGAATFVRDSGARGVARAHPGLAWGEHGIAEMLRLLGAEAVEALGGPLLVVLLAVVGLAAARRDAGVLAPGAALVATFLGIAFLAPVARVQPYYLIAVIPLGALTVAVAAEAAGPRARLGAGVLLAAFCAASVAPRLHRARPLYLPDPDAFMPAFARIIDARPEGHLVTVAHYDSTLAAYYLARSRGVPMDWSLLVHEGGVLRPAGTGKTIEPLARSHGLDARPDEAAAARLREARARGPVLVIERHAFRLEQVSAMLDECELLAQAPSGRLVRCERATGAPGDDAP